MSDEERNEEKLVEDEPLVTNSESIDDAVRTVLTTVPELPPEKTTESESDAEKATAKKAKDAEKAIAKAAAANIPMVFTEMDLGPSVASRVSKYVERALKVYKSLKYRERLTLEQFLKRMRVKPGSEREDRAACLAWSHLFNEHKIPVPQFYKPPKGDSTYSWLAK